jgi:hypothetical protein
VSPATWQRTGRGYAPSPRKIDRLVAALARPIDPRLAHYLQRHSYDKPLELLEGRSIDSIVLAILAALVPSAEPFGSAKVGLENQDEK